MSHVGDKIGKLENDLDQIFRKYCHDRIDELVATIEKEVSFEEESPIDHVSLACEVEDGSIIWMICSTKIDKLVSKCNVCQFSFTAFPSRETIYGEVPDCHPRESPLVDLGEIIVVYPFSYETITEILRNLLFQTKAGDQRAWVRNGFDGVPYRIANEIITNTVTCSIYDCEFSSDSSFKAHSFNKHQSNVSS